MAIVVATRAEEMTPQSSFGWRGTAWPVYLYTRVWTIIGLEEKEPVPVRAEGILKAPRLRFLSGRWGQHGPQPHVRLWPIVGS